MLHNVFSRLRYSPFPLEIRKDAEPEDWAAITVALQFYGCRNECGVLRAFGNFWGGMEKCAGECQKKAAPVAHGHVRILGADCTAAAGQSTQF